VSEPVSIGAPARQLDASTLMADALVFCLVLIGYVAGAYAAFELLTISDLGAAFFAPAGVSAAALLLNPMRRWWLIVTAVFIGEFFVDVQMGLTPLWSILGYAVANSAGPLAGAALVRHLSPSIDLARVKDLALFAVGSVVVGPFVSAVVGALTVWANGGDLVATGLAWWLGDALGVMIVGALVLSMVASDRDRFGWREFVTTFAITASFAIVINWWIDKPVGFVMVIPLMVLSSRSGVRAAASGSALITLIALVVWMRESGFVDDVPGAGGIVTVKLQVLTMAAAALFVAAESAELEHASLRAGYQTQTVELLRRALAPDHVVHAEHVDAEGFSQAASDRLKVGGDWYDVAETDDGLVSIVIGDVVGHGEEALVMMGRLRFAAQALVMLGRDSASVLDWLAEYARLSGDGTFATCFVAYYDPASGELNYASAGHPPALLGGDDGTWRWLTESRSTPIGVPSRQPRTSARLSVPERVTLVVYTDGVVERAGEVIDTGLARMFDAVVDSPDGSVQSLLSRVAASTADDASFVRVRLRR
jgi:integral membrane sensor domain MASE1